MFAGRLGVTFTFHRHLLASILIPKRIKRSCTSTMADHEETKQSEGDVMKITASEHLTIVIDKTPYTVVNEGKAEVLFPSTHDVFYNPVQEFNRDMSVAVIKEYIKRCNDSENHAAREEPSTNGDVQSKQGIKILEALAASGLRSIRYALEIEGIESIHANDFSKQAVESIKRNIEHNKVSGVVQAQEAEAALYMYQHKSYGKQFDVIDLDPYGSAAPFLDAAVQAVKDKGILLVTCTDMAILCGNSSETCRAKYGGVSLKCKCCHEMALRIVLQCIESHANRYGRYIVPLLSLSADFYVRIFVQVFTSPVKVKRSTSKLGMVYLCNGCESFAFQPLGRCAEKDKTVKYSPAWGPPVSEFCSHCGQKHQLGGPIWLSKLHDREFVHGLIERVALESEKFGTAKRMLGVLNVVYEELDVPLYYSLDKLSSVLHVSTPGMLQFRSAILNAGYKVSLSHAYKTSIKTDAPPEMIWDIMRAWKTQNPSKRTLEVDSPTEVIMRKQPSNKINFELHPEANPSSREKQLLRFQVNPEPNWGPKARAKTSLFSNKEDEKRKKLQGKRKKPESQQDQKKYPCKQFRKGECNLGEECKYSHTSEESTNEYS